MPVGKVILFGLLGLVMAEAAAFLMVAWAFGSLVAVVALMATSVLGLAVLARMGRRLAGRVVDILSHRDFGAPAARSSAVLTTIGGLLLVLPGFITDCIGLLLLLPAVQDRLRNRAPVGRPRPSGRIIELDPSQWRDVPERHIGEERDKSAKIPPKRARRR
jgi:UPF0716 family protein affecting phage T7 exclusion